MGSEPLYIDFGLPETLEGSKNYVFGQLQSQGYNISTPLGLGSERLLEERSNDSYPAEIATNIAGNAVQLFDYFSRPLDSVPILPDRKRLVYKDSSEKPYHLSSSDDGIRVRKAVFDSIGVSDRPLQHETIDDGFLSDLEQAINQAEREVLN